MNQMMENKQALFCPLEQNIQKLGTILSITPTFFKGMSLKARKYKAIIQLNNNSLPNQIHLT
jgi:hypothetical protein